MATHRSAIKRHHESLRRQTHNRWWKSRVKTATKAVLGAVQKKDRKSAEEKLRAATREIGRARSKGVLHGNTASRKVARLARLVATL